MIVPIPKEMIAPDTRPLERVRFSEEIEAWCATEIGAFDLKFANMADRKWYDYAFEAIFENESDAVLFKMRWM